MITIDTSTKPGPCEKCVHNLKKQHEEPCLSCVPSHIAFDDTQIAQRFCADCVYNTSCVERAKGIRCKNKERYRPKMNCYLCIRRDSEYCKICTVPNFEDAAVMSKDW